ncbi:MAG TPA: c-type cytochrome [Candidatus Angelobacter sp.]|jgi:outer membrane lipoprotein-sorting protein|nr:c-type cytochrome [Candidatus Angelobacter sp.]
MNRKWMTAVSASIIAVAIIANSASSTVQSAGDASKTAEQAYKNIQVLKGTPADQMIPTMQFISNSLGVDCEFCHTQGAFEKDDKKPKDTARKMIQMQFAINKDNFKGERTVTCFSCHRGSHDPVGTPIISEEEPKPEAPKPSEGPTPTADQVIDKYIQAVGGAEALQKMTSRSEKGTINAGGRQIPIEVLAKAPDKRISIMHTPNGDSITAYDGHNGWLGNPGGRPPRDMGPAEADAARLDADFNLPVDLKKIFSQFRVRPADKIGEHEAIQLIGIREGQPPVRLYFDKESGLLLRMVRYLDTPLGRNPTQIDYADYRTEGGVKIPYRWTLARPLGRFTIQVDQVQQNIPIDDSKFSKPVGALEPKPAK